MRRACSLLPGSGGHRGVQQRPAAPARDAGGGAIHVDRRWPRQPAGAGQGHPGAVVDAVPLARARRPGAPRARQQPDARAGAGEAAPGAGRPERAQRRDAASAASTPGFPPTASTSTRNRWACRRCRCRCRWTCYLASISVSYTFDFAGGTRRELEGLRAEVDHQQLRARSGAPDAGRQRRHHGDPRSVAARADRAIRGDRFAAGAPAGDRRAAWKRSAAWPAPTWSRSSASWRRHAPRCRTCGASWKGCATGSPLYVGLPPSAPGLPEFRLAELQLPAELPLSLPSQLARQRPDIRSAEALLARAGAQVGVATANLYPQLTLSAQLGALSTKRRRPVRRRQRLLFARRFADSAACSAAANCRRGAARPWRPTSRPAPPIRRRCCRRLQNVADVLRALEADAARLKERADAEERALRLRDITARAAGRGRRQRGRHARSDASPPPRDAREDAGRRRSLRRLGRAVAGPRRRLVAMMFL